jgi:hypothetical protein
MLRRLLARLRNRNAPQPVAVGEMLTFGRMGWTDPVMLEHSWVPSTSGDYMGVADEGFVAKLYEQYRRGSDQ